MGEGTSQLSPDSSHQSKNDQIFPSSSPDSNLTSSPPSSSPHANHSSTPQQQNTGLNNAITSATAMANPSSADADTAAVADADGVTMSDSQSSTDGDQDWSSDGAELDVRRVKVYELIGSRWTDRGTAFCNGEFDEPTQEAKLIARSETNQADILLCCSIRANDVYQRQQETLIVWTEPDGTDYALSFQDVEGCAEVWDFIVEVQRHLNNGREDVLSSPAGGPRPSITTQQIIQSGRLPDPQMGIISEIEKAIRALARTSTAKERICEYIQQEEYIKSMLDVFHSAEEIENISALHALCSCMQTILLLNDHTMYEHILSDDLWLGVVGMLEYDPEFPTYKANYRDFLTQSSRFLQPITIQDPAVQRKIHQTYRLQYLKDVILARALDDSTFNVLNSCIIFNQIDIINHVQNDDRFLKDVVGLFVSGEGISGPDRGREKEKASEAMEVDKPEGNTNSMNGRASDAGPSTTRPPISQIDDTARRKDVIHLIQQLCVMGKNVQLPARIMLFRTLVERGILYAVQWALERRHERHMVSTAGEILAVMLDHDTTGARTHVLKQAMVLERAAEAAAAASAASGKEHEGEKGKEVVRMGVPAFKETLVQVLCRMLAASQDLALQNQIADALRTLLDVPQNDPTGDPHHVGAPKMLTRPKDDPGTERFLDNFYKVGVDTLFKPILNDVPGHKNLTEPVLSLSREKANLYLYLCDLLCSFALQHSFRSHFFVLSSSIASHVASLLSVRDKHLCLAALRFFRICLRLNNRNLFNHLIKHDVLSPVLDLTLREARRDNLLSSTCQEFFEHMRKENMKDLINHVMSRREATLRELAKSALGSATFQGLITRWAMNNEPPPKEEDKGPAVRTGTRRWGQGRLLEAEEEDYFNNDDDDEDVVVPFSRPDAASPNNNLHKRKRLRVSVPGTLNVPPRPTRPFNGPNAPSPRASPLSSLLDYDEDDDGQVIGPHLPDSPRFASREDARVQDSPVLTHRTIQIPPSKPPEPSDPEDDLLEALVTNGQTMSGSSGSPAGPAAKMVLSMPAMRPKRRRNDDDDDDDELLERLASKSKRTSVGPNEDQPETPFKVTPAKNGDDAGPKKLKLKLGASSRAVAASPPVTTSSSRTSTKDGDGG